MRFSGSLKAVILTYLHETKDQLRPKRLEYVLGFLMSFLHTIMRMSLVITLAGGMEVGLASPSTAALGWSSAVELDPSLDSTGPSRSTPFGTCLFPKLNSSLPNSS